MPTKINNLEYDAPLEVRCWRHPAELAIVQEVENGNMYTAEVYTDGSKIGDSDGTAGIIFVNSKLVNQLKFKLYGRCSNNQAEQTAILKVLKKLELQDEQDNDKRVAIHTDSKITWDLLQNRFKRNRLIELIRNKIIALAHYNSRERKWSSYVATAVDEYGEGSSDQSFFPSVRNRLLQKIPVFQEFTTMLTGHGKIR